MTALPGPSGRAARPRPRSPGDAHPPPRRPMTLSGSQAAAAISPTRGRPRRPRCGRRWTRGPRLPASRPGAGGRRPPPQACPSRPSGVLEPAATTTASAVGRGRARSAAAGHSGFGWAKIMRPATVCSTRVTADLELAVQEPRAALDDDHRAVVEEADSLPDLLALLDDADPEVLAGQDGRLHRVGERVHVQHPHALELGHAVQVEIVGEDGAAARAWPGRRASRRPRRSRGSRRRRSRRASVPSFWSRLRISSPRRPRLRRSVSALSAIRCSSSSTNRETISVP